MTLPEIKNKIYKSARILLVGSVVWQYTAGVLEAGGPPRNCITFPRHGQGLFSVGKDHGMTAEEIKAANPWISGPNYTIFKNEPIVVTCDAPPGRMSITPATVPSVSPAVSGPENPIIKGYYEARNVPKDNVTWFQMDYDNDNNQKALTINVKQGNPKDYEVLIYSYNQRNEVKSAWHESWDRKDWPHQKGQADLKSQRDEDINTLFWSGGNEWDSPWLVLVRYNGNGNQLGAYDLSLNSSHVDRPATALPDEVNP